MTTAADSRSKMEENIISRSVLWVLLSCGSLLSKDLWTPEQGPHKSDGYIHEELQVTLKCREKGVASRHFSLSEAGKIVRQEINFRLFPVQKNPSLHSLLHVTGCRYSDRPSNLGKCCLLMGLLPGLHGFSIIISLILFSSFKLDLKLI